MKGKNNEKVRIALYAIVAAVVMIGCGEMNEEFAAQLFPSCNVTNGEDGKSAYSIWLENNNTGTEEDFIASLVGEDGLDAYSIAVANGYIGSVENWLQSLIGTNGTDGICAECNNTIDPEPEPNLDGTILMTFKTGMAIDNVKVGYLKNGQLSMMSDANVTEENGLTSVIYSLDLNQSATYMMGLEFTN